MTCNETDTAFGIGVNYDLGGARLGASVQRDYEELHHRRHGRPLRVLIAAIST